MAPIKCQYTEIEFEAKSARAKNHPQVAAWLAEASKLGTYGDVLDTIEITKARGAKTIEEFDAEIKKYYADRKARMEKYEQQRAEALRYEEERKKARAAQNALLKQNGYRWSKTSQLDEEDGFGEAGWHLYTPDGLEVTVAQALDEISRGREVVRAEIKAQEDEDNRREAEIETLKAQRESIKDSIRARGEMPQLDKYPQGEEMFDTRNAYGSGDVFIINQAHVYFIEVHGMDGDDWGKNNIASHALGWRVPADAALVERIKTVRDGLVARKAKIVVAFNGLSEIKN